MNKNLIRQQLTKTFLSEEKPQSLTATEKIQKDEKDVNDEYYDEVEGKMKSYDKSSKEEDANSIKPKKFNYSDDQTEYHDDMEIRNGMEMLQYDGEVSEEFKDRNDMYVGGDSKTGNKTYTGKWNPETGEGNGNTEPVWGASNADFGKELAAIIKRSAKKRDNAITPIFQMGDDVELKPENTKTVGDSRKVALEGIKRLNYKKEFNGIDNAKKLIPESYKVDNKVFEMTDGNEKYRFRWEGSLQEGEAITLRATEQTSINEDISKMKRLMGFKTEDTLGRLTKDERLNENVTFSEIWDKTKSILKETKNNQ